MSVSVLRLALGCLWLCLSGCRFGYESEFGSLVTDVCVDGGTCAGGSGTDGDGAVSPDAGDGDGVGDGGGVGDGDSVGDGDGDGGGDGYCDDKLMAESHKAYGLGSRTNPYRLCTPAQLASLSAAPTDWKADYRLDADLDMTGYTAANFYRIGVTSALPFMGVFDGAGHTVSNFTWRLTADDAGLFGWLRGARATVKNLHMLGADVKGDNSVGILVGTLSHGARVIGCSTDGTVEGKLAVGGLIGSAQSGLVAASSSGATVTSTSDNAGGLIGLATAMQVDDCHADGNVDGGRALVGGLVGYARHGVIRRSFASGDVTGQSNRVGGLVGRTLENLMLYSFARGSVSCDDCNADTAGPLVGEALNAREYMNSYRPAVFDCTASGGNCNAFGQGRELSAPSASDPHFSSWDTVDTWSFDGPLPALEPTMVDSVEWGDCSEHLTETPFSGGRGTIHDPFIVCTGAQLASIGSRGADDWNRHYILLSNVNLENFATGASTYTPIGTVADPFVGSFLGNRFAITRLWFEATGDEVGLFGVASRTALLTGVNLMQVEIRGNASNVGALVGFLLDAGAFYCSARGTVEGTNRVGGLVGHNRSNPTSGCGVSALRFCASNVAVAGDSYVGGLVGMNNGHIRDSYATQRVRGGKTAVGGLVGYNGDPINTDPERKCSRLDDSYATGTVSGEGAIGGLIGEDQMITASQTARCFAAGNVLADPSGGSGLGRLIGVGLQPDACYFNEASACTGCDSVRGTPGNGGPDYFFDSTNPPMSTWDFVGTWRDRGDAEPTLR